jgi:hypothetical protein
MKAMCSGCIETIPVEQMRVLPWYNEDLQGYVTTFRCPACFPQSLQETRDRLRSRWPEEAEVQSLALFFRNYSVFIHELLRGDRDDQALQVTLSMLEMLERGALRLPMVVQGKVVAPG